MILFYPHSLQSLPSCSAAAHGLHIVLSPIPIPSRRHLLLSTCLLPSSPSPNPDLLSTDRNQKAGGTFRSKKGRRSEIGSVQAPNRSNTFGKTSLGKVMGDPSKVKQAVICDGHFDLNSSKEVSVNFVSGYLLNLSGKAMWQNSMSHNKGIRVPPETNFCYKEPKNGLNLFVFEAGVSPLHAATMQNDIHIYVIEGRVKTYIVTLSSAYPKVQLDLLISKGVEIHHTSMRKVVYFNACEFKPKIPKNIKRISLESKEELLELRGLRGLSDAMLDWKPAKKSVDPEHQEYVAKKGKAAERQDPNLITISLVSPLHMTAMLAM